MQRPAAPHGLDAATHRHLGWNNRLDPVLEIDATDEVELSTSDCFDGQLGVPAHGEDVAALDPSRANPLTGPIRVSSAGPGDALVVEVLAVEVGDVGWTTNIPGFGLLADDFPDPHVVVSRVGSQVAFGDFATLAVNPFLGTVGVAPAAEGTHSVIPPRRVGGNLDCRDVREGARLWLPVEVDGAALSMGDAHAAQGDGEVCGTAVEVAARVHVRVDVRHGVGLDAPRLETGVRPSPTRTDAVDRTVTFGIGGDLYVAAQDATRRMIELLLGLGVEPIDGYLLCSVAGDLRIVEAVNAPSWVVAMELDLSVLG